jgi:hypothetical protein
MARWQLTEPHYLNVPGNKWELEIRNRTTGRPERKQFPVPLHLDPDIEGDWNYAERVGQNVVDGKIIVCWEGKGQEKDIIFVGPPTPGMLPIDDEAKAESAKYSWTPTQGLDIESQQNSFSQKLLIGLTEELKGAAQAAPQAEGMNEFMKTMAEMMKVQTEILHKLANPAHEVKMPPLSPEEEFKRLGKELGETPVVDTEPPLPEIQPRRAAGRRM